MEPAFLSHVSPMDASEDGQAFRQAVADAVTPMVLRGGVDDWESVSTARNGDSALINYLAARDTGEPVYAIVGQPAIQGRFGFAPDFRQLNHQSAQTPLSSVLGKYAGAAESGHAIAIQAAPARKVLAGWDRENKADFAPSTASPTLWLSNRAVVATHADSFDNVACVVAGQRRFTLFPPDTIRALALGPLVGAPGGVPVSTLDYTQDAVSWSPELERALASAVNATLNPGDVIFIPALWWHGVEALGSLNLLVNFWWGDEPTGGMSPYDAMSHAMLAISRLPIEKRQRWKQYFDHLVFRLDGDPGEHLPPDLVDLIRDPGDQQSREVALRIAQSLTAWGKR